MSLAIWIPVLVVFFASTRNPSGWLGLTGSGTAGSFANDRSGNLLDQAFYATSISAGLIIAYVRHVKWGKVVSSNMALMLFYAYFMFSFLWSSYPEDSLIRILKDFGCAVIVGSIILSEKDPLEALRAVYVRCAFIVIPLSAALVRLSRFGKDYGRNGTVMYTGAATQKNSFGELMLVSIMFLIWDHMEDHLAKGLKRPWSRMRWDHAFLVVWALWLLNISQSRTSLASLIIGLLLLLRTGWLASQKMSRFILIAALSYPVIALCGQSAVLAPVFEILGRDATFTGRSAIWQQITFDTVNPLIGGGYWNFWGGPGGRAMSALLHMEVPSAHNGYLDIYLDGGILGVALLVCLLIGRGRWLIKNLPLHSYFGFRFAFLITMIIHNVTESSFARLTGLWLVFVIAIMDFPALKDQVRPDMAAPEKSKIGRVLPALAYSRSAVLSK